MERIGCCIRGSKIAVDAVGEIKALGRNETFTKYSYLKRLSTKKHSIW